MSANEFLNQEVKKILTDNKFETPINQAMACAYIMGHFKGLNLKVLDLKKSATIADFFVIGSASNPTQAAAMAEEISHQMRLNGFEAISKEGLKQSTEWILLDYGDLIVHVFSDTARFVYDLDTLYSKAEAIAIPEEYYYSETASTMKPVGDDGRGYF